MFIDNESFTEPEPSETTSKDKLAKLYQQPCLVELGNLRTMTLGGSPGVNDTGIGDPFFPAL